MKTSYLLRNVNIIISFQLTWSRKPKLRLQRSKNEINVVNDFSFSSQCYAETNRCVDSVLKRLIECRKHFCLMLEQQRKTFNDDLAKQREKKGKTQRIQHRGKRLGQSTYVYNIL